MESAGHKLREFIDLGSVINRYSTLPITMHSPVCCVCRRYERVPLIKDVSLGMKAWNTLDTYALARQTAHCFEV